MQTMFDWLFNNEDIYPLNAPIAQVLVNTVVKGDFFLHFTRSTNCLQPRETLQKKKNPLTQLLLFLKTCYYVGQVGVKCILLCL